MAEGSFDFVVLGSGMLAGLIAGQLAAAHGKRVFLVGEPSSPFRLQRGIDLSVTPVTRPETLALLKAGTAELTRLAAGWGKGLTRRIDPLFIAETPASIAAMGHFRQLALMLGYAVEPVTDRNMAEGTTLRVRDAQLINHVVFEPALDAWLSRLDVRRLDQSGAAISIRKDGVTRVTSGALTVEAEQVVLASDDAALRYLPADALDRSLEAASGSAMLLEGGHIQAPAMIYLDRGITLLQEPRSTSLTAIATGLPETARARLGSTLAKAGTLRVAGETVVPMLRSMDGAPYVGPAKGVRATLVAALGLPGAFLAPAIARHLAGHSTAEEAAWLAGRGAVRSNLRLAVSDYAAVPA
ncbi:MAG: hypothetical protein ACO1OG_00840 [Devosia sp.]